MKRKTLFAMGMVALALAFGLTLGGCGGKQYTTEELKTALEKKAANTTEKPYKVALAAINIVANAEDISDIVKRAGKYVILDFSASVAPDNTISGAGSIISENQYIKGLILPKSITSIGDGAFGGCENLTSIIIPKGLTSIGSRAFGDCTGLTSVTIPEGVTSIGDDAFGGCINLASITVDKANTVFASDDGVLFNKDITTLILCPVGKIGSYTIPSSVTSLGNGAFGNCAGLTSVTIPEGIPSIGEGAFYGCAGLTSISIPDSITSIGAGAFYGCAGLASINIPEGVTSIGESAFYGCAGLTSVTIPGSVTSIKPAFQECTGLTSVTLSEGVTSIAEYAFNSCVNLASAVIPASVTSIGDRAFEGCENLASVTFGGGNTSFPYEWTTYDFWLGNRRGEIPTFPSASSLHRAYSRGGAGTYTRNGNTWSLGGAASSAAAGASAAPVSGKAGNFTVVPMDDQQYYVASPDAKVNVRSVPQTGEVLFQVNPMQNIIADAVTAEYSTIDGVRDRWVRIRADGKTGWLFGGFLDADRGIVKYPGVDQFPE